MLLIAEEGVEEYKRHQVEYLYIPSPSEITYSKFENSRGRTRLG